MKFYCSANSTFYKTMKNNSATVFATLTRTTFFSFLTTNPFLWDLIRIMSDAPILIQLLQPLPITWDQSHLCDVRYLFGKQLFLQYTSSYYWNSMGLEPKQQKTWILSCDQVTWAAVPSCPWLAEGYLLTVPSYSICSGWLSISLLQPFLQKEISPIP